MSDPVKQLLGEIEQKMNDGLATTKGDLEAIAAKVDKMQKDGQMNEFVSKGDFTELQSKYDALDALINSTSMNFNKSMEAEEISFKSAPENHEFVKAGHVLAEIDLYKSMTTKAIDDNTAIAGAAVGSNGIYMPMIEMNPFAALATTFQASTGSFAIPKLSRGTAAAEATVPATRTRHGSITSSTVVFETIGEEYELSVAAIEDLAGIDSIVPTLVLEDIAKQQAQDAVATLEAGITQEVTAAASYSAANIVSEMNKIRQGVGAAYRVGGQYVVNSNIETMLRESNNGTGAAYNYDIRDGAYKFGGNTVIVTDYVDAAGTANNNPIMFGNFRRGAGYAVRRQFSVSRHTEVKLGAVVYYGEGRSKFFVWDAAALAKGKEV